MEKEEKHNFKRLKGLVVLYFVENDLALQSIEDDELWKRHNEQRKVIRSKIEELIKST